MLQLRALEPEDLEFLYTIENDPSLWEVTSACGPYSRYALKQYLAAQPSSIYENNQLRLIATKEDGRAIGTVDLFDFSPTDRRAEIGLAILKDERGKGFGQEMLQQATEYARRFLNIHQLVAHISLCNNKRSLQAFRQCGFEDLVILTDWHFCNGLFEDVVLVRKFLR